VTVKNSSHIAIDLGAESCRVSLLRFNNGDPQVQIVHRFPNAPLTKDESLRWDIRRIYQGIEHGLRLSAELAPEGIASLGVDGWAVDYVRLGPKGDPISDPFCYRDERTVEAEREVLARISRETLYNLTGIQLFRGNTIHQLYADSGSGVDQGTPWLNLPEFITFCLGGKPVSEYTNATHTQLVGLGTHQWCKDVFDAVGLDIHAAPEIVPTGTFVGGMKGPLAEITAFRNTQLLVPACHDTASAVAGIPAEGDDWAFISSGTWSLVGTLLNAPCVNDESRQKSFTNLGGVGGKICYLKNVNGMWLLRQCLDSWESQGYKCNLSELISECESLPAPDYLFDVDAPELLTQGDMPGKINAQRQHAGFAPIPEGLAGIPTLSNSIFHSLAARYAQVLKDISALTGKRIVRLYIAGGGSKNMHLNRLTAERTGLNVLLASTESTTLGNFAIQLASLQGNIGDDGVKLSSVASWADILTKHSYVSSLDRVTK
jgi:rhamnulokinase